MSIHVKSDTILTVFLVLVFVAVGSFSAAGQSHRAGETGDVNRGKYLVEEVAKCGECHTPRDAQGNLDLHAWLQGAPVWIMPVRPIPNWADHVPSLAGLPNYTDEQMERVLEKGVGPQGEVLRPPMHIYHMNAGDAKAIIAYLKSLPPRGQ
jgi:mono/diheme cytochrome c family protein